MKKGFILFEVLMAIIVASVVIIGILSGMRKALKTLDIVDTYGKAVLVISNQLNLLELYDEFKEGRDSGTFFLEDDPQGLFRWEKKVEELRLSTYLGTLKFPLYKVTYNLLWKDDRRELEFSTYYPMEE